MAQRKPSPSKARPHESRGAKVVDLLDNAKYAEQTGIALKILLGNERFLQPNPFKTLVYALRKEEHVEGLLPAVHEEDVPRETFLTTTAEPLLETVALFGEKDAKFAGLKHVGRIISVASLRRVTAILNILQSVLVLPTSVKAKGIDAVFVESISVLNSLSSSFALPDNIAIESVVEGVITGSNFEDCLTCFIKRVVEEAFISERSKLIMANLKVVMNNRKKTVHTIPVANIKSKRNQVLSLVKAAILDDGEIYLDIFLFVNRGSPSVQKARTQVDVTEGFVNITRKYKFSYVDDKNNCRCFSKYPLESLLRGVFLDVNHAKLYVSVYSGHASRMKKGVAEDADVNLFNTLGLMADKTNAALEKGEIPVAMGWLIQLECLLSYSSTRKEANRCLQQLGSVMRSAVGYIRIVREAAICLRKAIRHISDNMTEFADKMDRPGDDANASELQEEKETVLSRYSMLAPSILALKALIVAMIRECNFSEMNYLADGLINSMWALFSPSCRADPLLDPDATRLGSRQAMADTIALMRGLDAPIKHICSTLFMLEVSCGVVVMTNIIERDYAGFTPTRDNYDNVVPEPPKPFSAVPRNLMELLGYVKAWSKPSCRPTSWTPFEVKDWLLYFCRFSLQKYALVPFYEQPSQKASGAAGPTYGAVSGLSSGEAGGGDSRKRSGILNACAELAVNDLNRLGAVDLAVCFAEEGLRYDAPLFMAAQAAKMRYLAETHVLRCMNEACYQTLNEPQTTSPYTTLVTNLFRFAAFLNAANNLPDESIDEFVFRNARKGLIAVPPRCKFGRYFMDLLDKFGACVVGPFGVLAGLGDLKQVYRFMWFVPPLFARTPEHRAGMAINIYGGVALESVMKLAAPDRHRLREGFRKGSLAGKYSYDTDEDEAALDYVGHVGIEVPVKILYEARREEQARAAFAETVSSAVDHMLSCPQWRFRCLAPADKHSPGAARELSFTKQDLASNPRLRKTMEAAVAKAGVAVVQADMVAPDLGELPSFEQFSGFFEASIQGSMVDQELGDAAESLDGNGSFLVDDTQRLCADKEVGRKLLEATRAASKSYVPCTIRFTLLASTMGKPTGREEGKSKFVEKLVVGSADDLARLTCSTLWFSQRAGKTVWSLADSSVGIQQCIALEALHNWYLHKESVQRGQHCLALQQAHVFALLTNRFRLASDLARLHQSFGMELMNASACLDMLVDIFSSKDLTSLNVSALGNALTKHMSLALRLVIASSESVHLQGGCALILGAVESVEKGLHLGQIEFSQLRGGAPARGLPHPSLTPRHADDYDPTPEESEETLGVPAEAILLRRLSVSACIAEVLEELRSLRSFALVLQECMGKDAFNSLESLRSLLATNAFPGYLEGGSDKMMHAALGPSPKALSKELWLRGMTQVGEVVVQKHHSMKLLSKQVVGAMKFMKAAGGEARQKQALSSAKEPTEDSLKLNLAALPFGQEQSRVSAEEDGFDPFDFKGDVSQPSHKLDAKTREDARLDRNQADYSFYYDSVHNQPNSFSARGFRRALGPGAGDSVAEALKGKSMLGVLRAYSAVDAGKRE